MQYRPLGSAGFDVSVIGFGAWGIGGRTSGETSYGETDDTVSLAALDCALDHGITFFDTSPAYGDGHSEELIGCAFAHRRDKVIIATKAGIENWRTAPDFSAAAVRRSVEKSLQRLGTDYIDVLQFHNLPPGHLSANPDLAEAMARMTEEGKLRSWGVSTKSPNEGLEIIAKHAPACLQVNINMLDVRALTCGLPERAAAANVGLIARTPLCFGFLSGAVIENTRFPEGDHRNAWPAAQIKRWIDGAKRVGGAIKTRSDDETPALTALRFCLSTPGVTTVIPGLLTPGEVEANARAGDLPAVTQAEMTNVLDINNEVDFFVSAS